MLKLMLNVNAVIEIKVMFPSGVKKYNLSLCFSYHVEYSTKLQFDCFAESAES